MTSLLRNRNQSMTVIIIFLLVGASLFVAMTFGLRAIWGRNEEAADISAPSLADNGQPIVVGNEQILIDPDADKQVQTASELGMSNQPTLSATAVPVTGGELVIPTPPGGVSGDAATPLVPPPLPTATPLPTLPPPPTATPVPVQQIIIVDYLVQPGDTLYQVAQSQRSSIELMAEYNIAADDLVPGTTIRLPIANQLYCSGRTAYVVREHETVYRIARGFNTTIDEIAQLNGLDETFAIYTGQVLCVP